MKIPKILTIAWCKRNKAWVKEQNEKFDKKRPGHWRRPGDDDYWKTKLQAHKIRAEKLNRLPRWADEQKIEQVFRDAPPHLEIDHEFPLQGELVSGLHIAENLRYLTTKENGRKFNNFKPRTFVTNYRVISLL